MSRASLVAIREHCKECCGDMQPKQCNCTTCKLYKYRLGKDPDKAKRELTAEQRAQAVERLAKLRQIKSK